MARAAPRFFSLLTAAQKSREKNLGAARAYREEYPAAIFSAARMPSVAALMMPPA